MALALFTTLLWGTLPIILKILLINLDPYTLTWYRFSIAAGLAAIVVVKRYKLKAILNLRGYYRLLFVAAVITFSGNFILYLLGLNYITPGTAQVICQLSIVFMLVGGLIVYKERLGARQWVGVALLIGGIILFFNQRYEEFSSGAGVLTGTLLVASSSVILATYTLIQKQLLQVLPSDAIMFLVYLAGALMFFPLSHPSNLLLLSVGQLALLTFSAFLTLIGFVSLAESLNHLEVNRVSMTLAIVPLVTLTAMGLGTPVFPELLTPERLNTMSITGAILVVGGCVLGSLKRQAW